jgi:hypothetical protein
MPDDPERRDDHIDTDDLFGKLDQLISRHQGRAAARAPAGAVPTLTETVEIVPASTEPPIPVLNDVVHAPPTVEPDTHWSSSEKRRQLQVALYLRLRQRLDQELDGAAFAYVPPGPLAQLAQALRAALPGIVRESVDQTLGGEERN